MEMAIMFFTIFSITSLITSILCKYKTYNMEIDFVIKGLNIMLHDIESPYVTIKILKKSSKKRYIKLGVSIKDEAIADALLGNSPLDKINEQINLFRKITWSTQGRKPVKIDVVLIE